jgi:hypothetical protein
MVAILPYLFLLFVLAFPSSNVQQFNGLPFSSWSEFLALALLVPFFIFKPLRVSVSDGFRKLRIPFAIFWVACTIALLLKILLLVTGPRDGFSGCYRSPAVWKESAQNFPAPAGCERSYEDLFGLSGGTRLDRTISFGKDGWNLVFLNTSRYDYFDWLPGVIPRDRIPIAAQWTGTVDIPARAQLHIQYSGGGSVRIGEISAPLPDAYGDVSNVEVEIMAGQQAFALEYAFDDGSRTGQATKFGPRAQIRMLLETAAGEKPLIAASPGVGWIALAGLADLLLIVCLLSLAPALWMAVRPDWAPLGLFAAWATLCLFLPLPVWAREILITIGLAGVWVWHIRGRPLRVETIYTVVLLASLAITRLWLPAISQVVLRSAGNDPLGYESQAYTILATGSLEGGEAIYVMQPGFRYLLFAEHVVVGDGNTFQDVSQLAFFFGAIFFLTTSLAGKSAGRWKNVVLLPVGVGLIFLGGYYVSGFIRDGLSEYFTWTLLIFTLPLLFQKRSGAAFILGCALLGISYVVRINQLPAILWILLWSAAGLWRRDRKAALIGILVVIGIGVLPLGHNLYFGHVAIPATVSGGVAANLPLPPSTWSAFFQGDPAAGAAVREQLGMLFLISDSDRSQWPTLAAMAFFLVVWLGVAGYSIFRGKKSWWPVLGIPFFYLAPNLFFVVNTYYPRHIAIAYLAMAATVFLVISRDDPHPIPKPVAPSAVKSN